MDQTRPDLPNRDAEEVESLVFRCLEAEDPQAELDRAAGDDPELHERARRIMNRIGDADRLLEPADEEIRIDGYRVLQELGSGGMGTVYLAEQREPVRRRVALKVIKLGMDSKQVLARFELERRALAMMNHDCIAKVFDAGVTRRGQPFFVMEYVGGMPLTEYADKHRLSIPERIELILRVCSGVQHAHQKGIIHRDLKPRNILVADEHGEPVPKIIDFGLARATDHQLIDQTLFTEHGQLIGTPEYMSPEQAEMSVEGIDTRTDVYALGVTLYEVLTGELPFSPEELRSEGLIEIQRMIRDSVAPKPSSKVTSLGEDTDHKAALRRTTRTAMSKALRGDLDWIVMTAIDKDRNRRYGTANELADDLRRFLKHEPVVARPPTAWYRLRKLVRRHKGRVAAAAALLLVGIGWLVTSTALFVRAERLREMAEDRATEATQVTDFVIELFREANPNRSMSHQVLAKDVVDRGAKRIVHELQEQPEVRARLLWWLGDTYHGLASYADAVKNYRDAEALLREIDGESERWLEVRIECAGSLSSGGDTAQAESLLLDARQRIERQFSSDRVLLAKCLVALRQLRHKQRRHDEALALGERVLEIRRELFDGDDQSLASALTGHGAVLFDAGRFAEARTFFESGFEMHERLSPGGFSAAPQTLQNLSRCLLALGELRQAEQAADRAVAMAADYFGEDHPQLATALVTQAFVRRSVGNDRAAVEPLRRAIAIRRARLGDDHTDTAWALNDLAMTLMHSGQVDEAVELMERAVAGNRKAYPEGHPHLAKNIGGLADAYAQAGNAEAAARYSAESVEMLRRLEPDTASLGWSLQAHAWILFGRGELDAAEQAVTEAIGLLADDPWKLGATKSLAAMLHRARNRPNDALENARTGLELMRTARDVDHAFIARGLCILGMAQQRLQDYDGAEANYRESIDMYRRIQPNHAWSGWSLSALGAMLVTQKRAAEAIPVLESAVAIRRTSMPRTNPLFLDDLHNLGVAYGEQQRLEDASKAFEEALAIRREIHTPPQFNLALLELRVAKTEGLLGRLGSALEHGREAMRQFEQLLPADHFARGLAEEVLGTVLFEQRDFEAAEPRLRAAHEIVREARGADGEDARRTANRLVELYDAWGRPADAAKFRRSR